ncbi:ATP-binding protein, partial [Streptomyces sp. NPDC050423]|uniref:sensor histidine kinase n=1 Tax=Streptomyces sp. NPDC050423 TaxID=3155402 RepID=UPI003449654A
PVTISARAEHDKAVVTVTDNGPGIPGDTLPHVFERFYKADVARARSEGSGLGLAIAQENARLHGGTLTAGNTPDHGAVFTLTLPLAASLKEQ